MKRILCATSLLVFSHLTFATYSDGMSPDKQNAADTPERFEQIEVWGRRTKPQLIKDFMHARAEFYDMFNALNDNPKFDMLCHHRRPVGSNIAVEECEPRYMKEQRADLISLALATKSQNSDVAQTPHFSQLEAYTAQIKRDSHQKMAELIQQNSELRAQWEKLASLSARIKE